MLKRLLWTLAIALIPLALIAAKEFRPPPPHNAATYPLHETHSDEHVSIAADPYQTREKLDGAKVPYLEAHLLPIRLIITNDGNDAISLEDLNLQLITAHRDKIPEANMDQIMRALGHPDKNPAQPSPMPFPFPHKSKSRVKQDYVDEVQQLRFAARAVGAHETQAGFVFFDVTGLSLPITGARLYITGILGSNGNELLYFEIPLDRSGAEADVAH